MDKQQQTNCDEQDCGSSMMGEGEGDNEFSLARLS